MNAKKIAGIVANNFVNNIWVIARAFIQGWMIVFVMTFALLLGAELNRQQAGIPDLMGKGLPAIIGIALAFWLVTNIGQFIWELTDSLLPNKKPKAPVQPLAVSNKLDK
jgi:hypothetical protein